MKHILARLLCRLGFHQIEVRRLFASGVHDFWPFDVCVRGCGFEPVPHDSDPVTEVKSP